MYNEVSASIQRIFAIVFLGLLIPLILNSALLAEKKESTTIKPITETTTIVPDPVFEKHLSQDWLEVERGLNNVLAVLATSLIQC